VHRARVGELVKSALQIVILSLLYLAFEYLARRLGSPVPGGVLGAIALATLLLFGVVPLRWFEDGAKVLLEHLALFFVPAAVVATRSWPAVRNNIGAVSAIAIVTTLVVLIVTGRIAERE
jgi:holin-like protein